MNPDAAFYIFCVGPALTWVLLVVFGAAASIFAKPTAYEPKECVGLPRIRISLDKLSSLKLHKCEQHVKNCTYENCNIKNILNGKSITNLLPHEQVYIDEINSACNNVKYPEELSVLASAVLNQRDGDYALHDCLIEYGLERTAQHVINHQCGYSCAVLSNLAHNSHIKIDDTSVDQELQEFLMNRLC
jgi:hypothetical protein